MKEIGDIETNNEHSSISFWDFFSYFTLIGGVIIGSHFENYFFPQLAYIIRDLTTIIFKILNMKIIVFNSSDKVGLAFIDYAHTEPNDIEIVHGSIVAQCLGIGLLFGFWGYFLVRKVQRIVKGESSVDKVNSLTLIGQFVIIFIYYIVLNVIRFILILSTFIILWETPMWSNHYFIGHDLIGNIILIAGLSLFFLWIHYTYIKIQFLRIMQKINNFLHFFLYQGVN